MIIEELCFSAIYDALEPRNVVWLPHKSGVYSFIQDRPWYDDRKALKPFLLIASLVVVLVSGIEKRKKET